MEGPFQVHSFIAGEQKYHDEAREEGMLREKSLR